MTTARGTSEKVRVWLVFRWATIPTGLWFNATLLVGPAEALEEEACGVLTGAFELEAAAALCMHEDG